jgi:ATP-binding protein involved in chromosome partitioning
VLAEIPILTSIRQGGDEGVPAALSDASAGATFLRLAQTVARMMDELTTRPAPEIIFVD